MVRKEEITPAGVRDVILVVLAFASAVAAVGWKTLATYLILVSVSVGLFAIEARLWLRRRQARGGSIPSLPQDSVRESTATEHQLPHSQSQERTLSRRTISEAPAPGSASRDPALPQAPARNPIPPPPPPKNPIPPPPTPFDYRTYTEHIYYNILWRWEYLAADEPNRIPRRLTPFCIDCGQAFPNELIRSPRYFSPGTTRLVCGNSWCPEYRKEKRVHAAAVGEPFLAVKRCIAKDIEKMDKQNPQRRR
jgi:hypothetical protein